MKEKQGTKDAFIQARKEKKKVILTHFSGEYSLFLTKLCIPIQHALPVTEFDFDYYFFWDEHADVGDRLFGLPLSDIVNLEIADEIFDPNDYILPNMSDV